MPIDWFTVGAQMVNFLVLVWLLKRFLYAPILRALDEREKKIVGELTRAAQEKRQAESERDEYTKKNDEFERQRLELLKKASIEAGAEKRRLLELARNEVRDLRKKQLDEARDAYSSRKEEIRRRLAEGTFSLAAKVLQDLAEAGVEERMVDKFLDQCRGIDRQKKDLMIARLQTRNETILIRSTLPLPEPQQKKLQDMCREVFGYRRPLRFEVSPTLVCGIALIADGYEIAWSFSRYLDEVETKLDEQLACVCPSDAA